MRPQSDHFATLADPPSAGQSESGKSAVLKNFQMAFTPHKLDEQRHIWKHIIQLNLISNVKTLVQALQSEYDATAETAYATPSPIDKSHRRLLLSLSPLLSIDTNPESSPSSASWQSSSPKHKTNLSRNFRDDPTPLLEASKDDILALWNDLLVHRILLSRNILIHSVSGFFLNDIERIASPDYVPTNTDIVRARVSTIAVEEHHFVIEKGLYKGQEFYIADVAGSRTARASWVPYFDDVQAILFLAPLVFNQMLEEDPRINRLEDSLMAWRELCANPLLANCNIILFFNKKDILKANLDAGVPVNRYVPSFGNTPNDVANVTKYFRDRFRAYHKKLSPRSRPFTSYETSAIDIQATAALVVAVQEGILREHLRTSNLI